VYCSVRIAAEKEYAETTDQAFVYSAARKGRSRIDRPRKRWKTEAVIGMFVSSAVNMMISSLYLSQWNRFVKVLVVAQPVKRFPPISEPECSVICPQ
jgi:hypothetical protein